MKKCITILLIVFIAISCKKKDSSGNTQDSLNKVTFSEDEGQKGKKSDEVFISGDLIIYDKKPYNGLLYENYENGNPKFKCNIVEGGINGEYIIYYENGTIKSEGTYKNNLFYPKNIKVGKGLTDVDGINYPSTIIGNQEWMSENLKTSHFSNGDPILYANTAKNWAIANLEKKPAFCYVEDDESDPNNYGKLYNYYAMIDPRGLAPKGWKIPNKKEWEIIRDYTGNDLLTSISPFRPAFGETLKSTQNWYSGGYDDNGNNYTGFNATPNGWVKDESRQNLYEYYYARDFMWQNEDAIWWINSTESLYADIRVNSGLNTDNEPVPYSFGISVRCLKIDKK